MENGKNSRFSYDFSYFFQQSCEKNCHCHMLKHLSQVNSNPTNFFSGQVKLDSDK